MAAYNTVLVCTKYFLCVLAVPLGMYSPSPIHISFLIFTGFDAVILLEQPHSNGCMHNILLSFESSLASCLPVSTNIKGCTTLNGGSRAVLVCIKTQRSVIRNETHTFQII